jgi:hypothetical protein
MGPFDGIDFWLVAAFAIAAFVVAVGAVLVSGFLPRASGPASGRGPFGAVLVYGAAAVLILLAITTLVTAAELPWAIATVVAGLVLLAAPFAVQPLPEAVRESRAGLITIVALAAVALTLLPTPSFL